MSHVEQFHAHLETCAQCRTQPMNLCAEGADALVSAVQAGAVGPVCTTCWNTRHVVIGADENENEVEAPCPECRPHLVQEDA